MTEGVTMVERVLNAVFLLEECHTLAGQRVEIGPLQILGAIAMVKVVVALLLGTGRKDSLVPMRSDPSSGDSGVIPG
jgi:hypothetical protein